MPAAAALVPKNTDAGRFVLNCNVHTVKGHTEHEACAHAAILELPSPFCSLVVNFAGVLFKARTEVSSRERKHPG